MQTRSARYEIERPVAYRVKTPTGAVEGTGKTLNISRSGVLFEPEQPIGVGAKIDMRVQMGDAVGAGAAITLQVQGVTQRTQQGVVAVAIKKYKLQAADAVAE